MPDDGNLQDAKSFIEHVRTVHFALLITAISLMLAALHDRNSTVRRAVDDLKVIEGMAPQMSVGSLEAAALRLAKRDSSFDPRLENTLKPTRAHLILRSADNKTRELTVEYDSPEFSNNIKISGPERPDEQPTTLKAFADRWNALNRAKQETYVLLGGEHFDSKGRALPPATQPDADRPSPITFDALLKSDNVGIEPIGFGSHEMAGYVYDIGQNKLVREIPATFSADIQAVSGNGQWAALISRARADSDEEGQPLCIWNFDEAAPKKTSIPKLTYSTLPLTLAINDTGTRTAVVSTSYKNGRVNNAITIMDVSKAESQLLTTIHGKRPIAFVGNSNGLLYVPIAGNGIVYLASPLDGAAPKRSYLREADFTVDALAVSADGRWGLVVCHEELDTTTVKGSVWAIDLVKGTPAERIGTFDNDFKTSRAAFSRDGKTAAVAAADLTGGGVTFRCWTVAESKWIAAPVGSLPNWGMMGDFACSPTGDTLALSGNKGILVVGSHDLEKVSTITPHMLFNAESATVAFMGPRASSIQA